MSTQSFIGLVRGVNVGGKRRLAMTTLREAFVRAGATDVRTSLQSGNVVFRADPGAAASCQAAAEAWLRNDARVDAPICLLSGEELARALACNPFLAAGQREETCALHVLRDEPLSAAVNALDLMHGGADRYVVLGRIVYLSLPGGLARTRLANAFFERALGTSATCRNLRTLRRLAAMAQE